MPAYRLVVEYDGTAFHGLQFQPGLRTIAGTLEGALCSLFHSEINVAAAGRTDAGVHATGQVISFKSEREFPTGRLALALNATLPVDLCVRDATIVADGFSARFDAYERVYEYLILNRVAPSAVMRRWTHHVYRPLDVEQMRKAAEQFVGTHDFVAFCGMLPEAASTERTVNALEVEREGELVRIRVFAESYLHRMVRIAVGTLIEVGTGRRDQADVAAVIASKERRRAGYTAPANGLFLAGVRYPDLDSYARPQLAYAGA